MQRRSVESRASPFDILKWKNSIPPEIILTAADYPTACLLDEAGVKCIHVGDSLGMVVLGYPDTTYVSLEDMLHHLRAVSRGVKKALITADVPACCMATPHEAVQAARQLVENGAHAVKLEGGRDISEHIMAVAAERIPLQGHIGLLPQRAKIAGGYRKYGSRPDEAESLVEDALFLQQAGCFSVVLECINEDVAARITRLLNIPTVGIYSGIHCDAQIRVTHDLLGLSPWCAPKSNRPLVDCAVIIKKVVEEFRESLRNQNSR
jgi:3-methyl-2-oxobutanoate hydroxymethyltransferase